MNRFAAAAAAAYGALLLCVPVAAQAQDAPAQPAPTSSPVLTDPRIPGDFSLPPSDTAPQVVGPTRPADAPPRETVVPQPAVRPTQAAPVTRAQPTQTETRRPAPDDAPAPRVTPSAQPRIEQPQGDAAPEPEEANAAAPQPGETTLSLPQEIAGPPAQSGPVETVAEPLAAEEASGFGSVLIAVLIALLSGIAAFVFLRRRQSAGKAGVAAIAAPQVERPVVAHRTPSSPAPPEAAPTPPEPQPEPQIATAQIAANGYVQSRAKAPMASGDSGLVTSRRKDTPQPSDGLVSTRAPASGLVSTNLAQKLRDRAEAEQRAKRAAPPPPVKRKISFDWS